MTPAKRAQTLSDTVRLEMGVSANDGEHTWIVARVMHSSTRTLLKDELEITYDKDAGTPDIAFWLHLSHDSYGEPSSRESCGVFLEREALVEVRDAINRALIEQKGDTQ